jgi:hypothetical protein
LQLCFWQNLRLTIFLEVVIIVFVVVDYAFDNLNFLTIRLVKIIHFLLKTPQFSIILVWIWITNFTRLYNFLNVDLMFLRVHWYFNLLFSKLNIINLSIFGFQSILYFLKSPFFLILYLLAFKLLLYMFSPVFQCHIMVKIN